MALKAPVAVILANPPWPPTVVRFGEHDADSVPVAVAAVAALPRAGLHHALEGEVVAVDHAHLLLVGAGRLDALRRKTLNATTSMEEAEILNTLCPKGQSRTFLQGILMHWPLEQMLPNVNSVCLMYNFKICIKFLFTPDTILITANCPN